MSDTTENKLKALENLQLELDKTYGKGSMFAMDGDGYVDCERISSGSISLDIALGGGYGVGKMAILYGAESSGKTTLAQMAMKSVQEREGHVAIVDSENAFNKDYAIQLGVEMSKLRMAQPSCLEECWGIIQKCGETGALDMIVYDSVEGVASRKEIEGEIEESNMGLRAKINNKGLRIITSIMNKKKTTFIAINQVRQNIGVMFGSDEVLPGGNGWKYYASQTVRLSKLKKHEVKDKDSVLTGYTITAVVKKNKLGIPFMKAEIPILIGHGIYKELDLLRVAVQPKIAVMEKQGAWYSYGGTKIGHGEDKTAQFLVDNPEMYDEIYKKVREIAFGAKDWAETK